MTAALLVLVLATPAGAAGSAPHARVEVSPKSGAWVGQRVTLAVTLSTPDLFAGVPSFEMPPIPGAVVLPPAGSPTVGSERVGDTTFTTQRHEFAVYAQRPGTVRIPAFTVRFETNAGFGKPAVKREVATDAVSFEVRMPPGAEGLGTVIAARGLRVADEWSPEPKSLKVGDALTRTVTTTAQDVPGMVFPPVRFGPVDGLAAYPKGPVVDDRTNRGELTGRRTDAVTFVCERPGTVTIPDRTLTWFDLDAKALRTVTLPGRTFEVAPDPKAAGDHGPSSTPPTTTQGRRTWRWLVPALGMAAAIGWLLATRVPPWWRQVRAARAESEAAYFARLRKACRSGDPHAVYVGLLEWLDHLGPMSPDTLTATANDPQLTHAVADLRNRLFTRSGSPGPWPQARTFFARVRLARQHVRSRDRATAANRVLPPLNKTG